MATLQDPDRAREALRGWLAVKLGVAPGAVEISPFETPAAGQSNITLMFDARWPGNAADESAFVLRLQPRGTHQIFLDPDIGREFHVMQALHGTPVPVPRMLWLEPDPDLLGGSFCVMRRVPGTVAQGKPSHHVVGWLPTLEPRQRARLWRSALETLVAVHAIDWRAHHGFLAERLSGPPGLHSHLDHLAQWYAWAARGRAFPITDAALDWLRARAAQVDAGEPVLVWGDARIGNMIVGADFNVAAALDWELATLGPAGIDLGYWLMMDAFHGEANGYRPLDGFPDRAQTIETYERLSGRPMRAAVGYFTVMAAFFMAVTMIRQADAQVAAGRIAPDTTLAHANTFTQMLARDLGMPVPELSADFLRHRKVPAR
ncbi:MAG: phosphotransferase family protein [Gammaproteobacteria bacterium]